MSDWQRDAACVGADWRLFFPPAKTNGRLMRDTYAKALTFCGRCPVKSECLAFAMGFEHPKQRDGIYGGLMPSERDRMGSGRRKAAA